MEETHKSYNENNNLLNKSQIDLIPIEYQRIFREIPKNEQESFFHSLLMITSEYHEYVTLLDAIERTIEVFDNPSEYWYFLYGRLAFVTSNYDQLFGFYEDPKHHDKYQLFPFLGRTLSFQNKYEEAIEFANNGLERIDVDSGELTLLEIYTLFELYFTLGLAYAYTRQFELGDDIVAKLENLATKYYVKKIVTDEYFLDLVYIEYIIKAYLSFFKGKPKEMTDAIETISNWVDNLNDSWLRGFYFNVVGVSKIMFQQLNEGEAALKRAFDEFELVHDFRGYTTVGANIAVSLITRGQRAEGREYLENVIAPQVELKSYWLAVGNMLTVAKTYLDEKNNGEATKMLVWAEETAEIGNIKEPAIYSMFCYFYSRVRDLEKAAHYLKELEIMYNSVDSSERDNYLTLYYYNASAINATMRGDLNEAQDHTRKGINLADKSGYLSNSLEFSLIELEIILKRYLVDPNDIHLNKAYYLYTDLLPLIGMTQNTFYETIFYLMVSYVLLGMSNQSEATEYFEKAVKLNKGIEGAMQNSELDLYKSRLAQLDSKSGSELLQKSLMENWLTDDYLSVFYVLEALRLLSQLQFEKTNLEQQKEKQILPIMLFIIGPGGITTYTHKFKEGALDEVLIGGFLSALTTFTQELFGGGMLTRIDQENHVLLIEKISKTHLLVLIVDEETYSIRKKFKRFSDEISRMDVIEYLDANFVLMETDPQHQILEGIVQIVFTEKDVEEEE